jgi:hypothetical protein
VSVRAFVYFERYPQVEVSLRYNDPEAGPVLTETLRLKQGENHKSWSFRISDLATHAFDYKVTYYPHGAEPIFREWQTSNDLVVNIGDPPELS